MTDGSFSKIIRKPDGSFEVHAESRWMEAHYEVASDAAPEFVSALDVAAERVPQRWRELLGTAAPIGVREWLESHDIPYRTLFTWYDSEL